MPKPSKQPPEQAPLLDAVESDRLVVNGQCIIYEQNGIRVVMVAGVPVYRYHRDDKGAENVFIAQAQQVGYATSGELAAVLGRTAWTMRNIRRRFEEGGSEAVLPKKPGPKKGQQRLLDAEDAAIRKWHSQGLSGRQMAIRLKKAPATVQKALRRLGLPVHPSNQPDPQQSLLPSDPEPD